MTVIKHGDMIGRAVDFAVSPYPPSFDNNPLIFGWALFARLLIMLLAAATLARMSSKARVDKLPGNHPVFYHRAVITAFLWAALIGSTSDVLTYLVWNEVSNATTSIVLLISRLLDAISVIPFLCALFPTIVLNWLCHIGVLRRSPTITLNGVVNDVRAVWDSKTVPLQLLAYSAVGAAAVTTGKYVLWLEHAGR
jgi:F0F1-type ATP synthase assembly protein I